VQQIYKFPQTPEERFDVFFALNWVAEEITCTGQILNAFSLFYHSVRKNLNKSSVNILDMTLYICSYFVY